MQGQYLKMDLWIGIYTQLGTLEGHGKVSSPCEEGGCLSSTRSPAHPEFEITQLSKAALQLNSLTLFLFFVGVVSSKVALGSALELNSVSLSFSHYPKLQSLSKILTTSSPFSILRLVCSITSNSHRFSLRKPFLRPIPSLSASFLLHPILFRNRSHRKEHIKMDSILSSNLFYLSSTPYLSQTKPQDPWKFR